MLQIQEYTLHNKTRSAIRTPRDLQILGVTAQDGQIVILGMAETDTHDIARVFECYPLGTTFTVPPGIYVGAAEVDGTRWYVFEVP
jgi:hypothetical protein